MPLRAIYKPEPLVKRWTRRVVPYIAVALISGAALGLTLAIPQVTEKPFFVLFFAAVGLCTWCYGLVPGMVSVAIDGLALAYFVLSPTGSLRIAEKIDLIRLAVFLASSI